MEIDEEPLTKALWDFYKHLENQGQVRAYTDEEKKFIETPLTPDQEAESIKAMEALKAAISPKQT